MSRLAGLAAGGTLETGEATVGDLVVRLRETAGRLVPFSQTKTLLREAAATIERLDGEARDHVTQIARLTSELNKLRTAPRGA
jgi:hypothetical protein